MIKSIIATTALAAGAAAYSAVGSSSITPGTAKVVNGCKYDVYLSNTPAADGGFVSIDKTLSSGETYSQQFTMLSNLMGWSIKLSKDNNFGSNILQYEYTYLKQDNIWFDLSEVDGNPWNGNWEITATGGDCSPRQAAYRFSTDDAYGMQDCPAASDITVLLCSGESQADGLASAVEDGSPPSSTALDSAPDSSKAPAPSSSFVQKVQVAPTPEATPSPSSSSSSSSEEAPAPPATTLATQAAVFNGVVVTEFATVVVTEIATATQYARDLEHVHRHVHRHPHARR